MLDVLFMFSRWALWSICGLEELGIDMEKSVFADCVNTQVALLRAGKPLEAFDQFFAGDGLMFANDVLFATGAAEGRRKQVPFIASAASIDGAITDVKIIDDLQVCVFRNKTSFCTAEGVPHRIDGMCWQQWSDGKIVEERYYDGNRMRLLITQGILGNPDMMIKDYKRDELDEQGALAHA
ncbi:hypothetical protein DL239_00460 [Sedimentitalea sp. CY04]|uniref:Nuclear transport factor 2 family protein n=2 Tax=Parasedimentitalea denitrificans TaxID=2211118 RepID=A0ABX0W1C0_9RHOB|nr:hypothetical protein [Sedimentitalea sp. CY04]